MPEIKNTLELKEAIRQLELKQSVQVQVLKDQVHSGFRHIKRASLIKNTIVDMVTSPIVLSTAFDYMTGIKSTRPVKQASGAGTGKVIKDILSILVKFGIARLLVPRSRSKSERAHS
jgi:hypothetical protein